MVSPSAKKGNWPNSWRKVFTDTETPSLFQGVHDTKPIGESPGGLPVHTCAHLTLNYLLPHTFVTDVHLPKQNDLFHLHSKQGTTKRQKLNSAKMGKSWGHWPTFSRSVLWAPRLLEGAAQSCSTKDEKKVSASGTSHIMHPSPTAANSQQGQEELNEEVPHPSGSETGRVSWILLKRGSLCQTALWPDLGRSFSWEKLRKPRLLMKAFFSFLVFVPSTDQALRSCVFPHFPQGTLSKTSPTTPHHNPPVTMKDPQLQGCSVDPAVHASDISSHKTRFLLEHSTIATPSEQLCSWDLCACPQTQKSYA